MRTRAVHSGELTADVEFCLVLPRESLSVPVMRRVLGDTLTRLGVDQASVDDLLLAVTEACTNVLLHAGPGRRYELIAHVSATHCLVEVVDGGAGFAAPPLSRRRITIRRPVIRSAARAGAPRRGRGQHAAPTPAAASAAALRSRIARARRLARERVLGDLPESGRGLAIMRACVDDVTLASSPGEGTVVSLHKQIARRADAPRARDADSQLRDAG